MQFMNPILFVSDLERSQRFYVEVMGMSVVRAVGDVINFDSGLEVHEGTSLQKTVWGEAEVEPGEYGRKNMMLYFEDENIDAAFAAVAPHVRLIHPVQRQAWGQRMFRFLDPDGHAIEVGEARN